MIPFIIELFYDINGLIVKKSFDTMAEAMEELPVGARFILNRVYLTSRGMVRERIAWQGGIGYEKIQKNDVA